MIRVIMCCAALSACLLGAAGLAWAEAGEVTKPLHERWIPSVSGGLVVFEDKVDGFIDSTVAGFSDAGSDGTTVPRFMLGLDLMSPALATLPGGPRIVGFGGMELLGPNEWNQSAGVGDNVNLEHVEAEVANASIPRPPNPGSFPPPESFEDQGSFLETQRQDLGWYLGVGMVFEFPDRDGEDPALRLRPFLTYVGEQIELQGGTVAVQGQPAGVPPVGSYTILEGFVSKKETLHYLGPGIDAELVVASLESTTVSLFARVSFLWSVGDDSFTETDRNGVGTYHFDVDDFVIRPGGGIRVAWRGGL